MNEYEVDRWCNARRVEIAITLGLSAGLLPVVALGYLEGPMLHATLLGLMDACYFALAINAAYHLRQMKIALHELRESERRERHGRYGGTAEGDAT